MSEELLREMAEAQDYWHVVIERDLLRADIADFIVRSRTRRSQWARAVQGAKDERAAEVKAYREVIESWVARGKELQTERDEHQLARQKLAVQALQDLDTIEALQARIADLRATAYRPNSSTKLTLRTMQLMLDAALTRDAGSQ